MTEHSQVVADPLSPPQSPSSKSQETGHKPASLNYSQEQANKTLCRRYSSTGTGTTSRTSDMSSTFSILTLHCLGSCPFGPKCYSGTHDANKTALCPSVLRRVQCVAGNQCDLSHVASPERVPTCIFHLRGRCTRPECLYSHDAVDPDALVCSDFAHAGYCENGASCQFRHLRQCPDYSNSGDCPRARCRLPHVDEASQQRKQASIPYSGTAMAVTVTVSDQEVFSQQQDYIPF